MNRATLHRVWYGGEEPGLILRVLEGVYRAVADTRRRRGVARICHDLERYAILVVGNITAGGAGKTPLVIRICQLLRAAGLRPGVVSRGYGRRARGQIMVNAESTAEDAGDEPVLIARRCAVPVVVDADREAAVRAVAGLGVDIVIADDGLQRWRLPRDIEICVMDSVHGFGNGRLLPAGPLREPLSRLETVDYLVSNGGEPSLDPGREVIAMRLEPGAFKAVGQDKTLTTEEMDAHVRGRTLHAVAGIAFPERFFGTLQNLGLRVDECHEFTDHHRFTSGDFNRMEGVVIMTEKDAVKCAGLGLDDAWALPVEARLPESWERELADRALALVKEKPA